MPYLKPASEGGIGSISGIVQEDALEDDGTGNPDLSQGNPDSGSDAKTITGSTNNDSSLSQLISAGADEEIRAYGVISDVGAIGAALGGVTSKGKGLVYTSDGQTVTAYADEDNSGDVSTGDREVFTLTVNSTTGDWSFELNDQLDHVDGAGDDGTLLKNNGSNTDPISSLNFSEVITVTDYDNDTVTLYEATGKDTVFTVTVENDVPVAVNDSGYSVGEGGIGDSEDDDALNAFISDSDNEKFFDSGNVLDNDSVGADEDLVLQSFTYINESGDKVSGDLDQWVNTVYGAFKLESNGDFFYVSDPYSKHSTNQNTLYESITYSLKDADGDEDDAELKIGITDTAPGIQAPDSTTIHEKYLPTGSAPDSDKLTNTESITFTRAADPVNVVLNYSSVDKLKEASLYEDVNGESVATFDDLTSKGAEVSYDISNDKRTITAFVDSDGNGVYDLGDSLVFTLEIIGYDGDSDPDEFTQDDDLNYTFTLYRALDHISPVERSTDQIDMTFEVMMYDYQEDANDYVKTGIGIAIMDDEPGASTVTMVVDEDSEDSSPENTITTSADGDGTNLTISTGPSHGSAEVNDNGTITYTPDPDYSGDDQFEYTYTDEDGVDHIITVDVTVNPISDAPGVSSDSSSVSTPEDVAVVLGFNAPTVTDDNDQTDPAADDIDNPERLGLITLSGVPAGAQLRYGTSSAHDATGADITIFLTDGDHIAGAQADATLSMTSSEFEAMEIIPPADTADNFTVTMKVTEYEVDSSGVPRTGVPGAESSASVVVDVQAITDPVDITWDSDGVAGDSKATLDAAGDYDGSLSRDMNEDESFDLSALIDTAFIDEPATSSRDTNEADLDGSEYREIVLENLPEGSVVTVDGTDYTIGSSGTISIPFDNEGYGSELPTIELAPPADFSGDIDGITVTLQSTDHEPSGETDSAPYIITEKDSITLNLHVYPVAGDVTAPDVETTEDTPVKFLENLEVTDTSNGVGNGGKETIIDIVIKDIPDGWVLNAGSTTIIGDGTTDYTVTNAHLASKAYLDYTLTPPAHSSTDGTVTVSVTTEDKSNVDGPPNPDTDTKTTDLEISVKVTPVAERIGTDSDEDGQTDTPLPDIADTDENGTADLQMNPSHTYTQKGNEDEWFDLSEDGAFKLQDGWINAGTSSNEDSDEDTYALLTPLDSSGSPLIGAQFSLDGSAVYATYFGSPVQVPVDDLDELQFRPPANYAAEGIRIKVEAKTVDTDPDDNSTNTQISGEVYLTLNVGPVADLVTLQANTPGGYEDEAIPLYIKPSSSDKDGSETYTIKIADIPVGAKIEYWDASASTPGYQAFTATTGTTSLEIPEFDHTKDLSIMPPLNSNADFVLQVSGKSVDTVGTTIVESDLSDSLPLKVSVRGVADVTDDVTKIAEYTEGEVDSILNNEIPLLESTKGPWQSSVLTDNDGSETMSVMLTDLTSDFDLSGSGLVFLGDTGSDRQWIVSRVDLDNVKIVTPEHFSGTITLKATPMTTENDGHTLSAADGFTDNPVTLDLTVKVTPTPEAILATGTSASEDTLTKLDMSLVGPDSSESLTSVKIKIDDVDNGDFTLYWGNSATITLASAASDSSITQVSKDSSGEYYEITGAAAVGNIYVVGAADSHGGPYDVEVKYTVTDTTDDGTLPVETSEKTATHSVTVTAVTDDITETLGNIVSSKTAHASISGTTVDLTGNTELTVPVTVSQQDQVEAGDVGANGPDADGSETLLRFEITNVPEGVSVDGATYSGDVYNPTTGGYENSGRWIIELNQDFTSRDILKNIVLKVDGSWDELQGLNDQVVTIRAYSADDGDEETFAAQTVTLNVTGGDASSFAGVPELYPTITKWNGNPDFTPVEDTASPLNEMIDSSSVELGGSGDFTVTISGLPTGSSVQGIGVDSFTHNGQTVWTVSGSGGTNDLQDLLANVTITPPPDENSNNSAQLDFDLTLTTYGGSSQENAVVEVSTDVVPDSDTTSVVISASDVGEEVQATAITVELKNDADDPHTILQDGKLYIQLDESGMTDSGGSLALDSGGTSMTTVTNPDGLSTGTYYEISGVTYGNDVQLTYTSANDDASGSVRMSGYVLTIEENEPVDDVDILVGSGSGVFTVVPYVDGYDFEVQNSSGDEFSGGVATSADRIALNVVDNGLLDTDGSEKVVSAILTGVPNGFLVYAGDDDASATMALNGGDDGSGTNQWILRVDADGTLPDYIGIQPPEDVSGSFELQLAVAVQESDGSESTDTDTFDLVVNPIAYPIDSSYFNPTDTFGDEGDMVPINLNVSLGDTVDFYPPENGVDDLETVTMTLKGMGPYASFYDAHGSYIDSVSYDDGTDTYTLSGIPADEINEMSFVQSAFEGTVDVTLFTVDGSSDSSAEPVTGSFDVTVYETIPSTGDDVLLYDGVADADGSRSYNGLAGDDVLQMRNNEDLDFNDLPDISNIEVLDMSNDTANEVRNLSPEDVLDITDGDNKLFIDVDGYDSVLGEPGSTWTQEADQSIGGTTYEVYSATVSTAGGSETVTLYVDNEATISL
ncbi:MAG: cadherin-like domain-containing protein [Prosthecochloris sp.]|nr:cadherin-like domain-containing protein [Prosthecochloris sp.]